MTGLRNRLRKLESARAGLPCPVCFGTGGTIEILRAREGDPPPPHVPCPGCGLLSFRVLLVEPPGTDLSSLPDAFTAITGIHR